MQISNDRDQHNLLPVGTLNRGGESNSKPTRVKTRLLHRGYPRMSDRDDIFGQSDRSAMAANIFPHGLITVIGGPERGNSFELTEDFMRIGRSDTQEIQLLNDDTVSRESHAVIGFVPGSRRFVVFSGGKVNPVLVNGAEVSDAAFLENGDTINIGESALHLTIY